MDNKKILLDLIKKYIDIFNKSYDCVICRSLVKKIDDAIVDGNPQSVKIDYDKILSITEEEMKMFSNPDCEKFITSVPTLLKLRGFKNKDLTILNKLQFLKKDLIDNKLKTISIQQRSLDAIYEIINNDLIKVYYKVMLDFIRNSYESKLIDLETSVNLSFYVLEKCNDYGLVKKDNVETEIVELDENNGTISDNRRKLEEIFTRYGYRYDVDALRKCGGEEKFVKYAKFDYVEYVLGKFKRYGIKEDDLYIKKTFYNIVIDNDKETFNSILDFVDHNDCSLSKLLYLPAIFAKRDREYVMKSRRNPGNGGSRKNLTIYGCNVDFFKNVELYAKLKGDSNITNIDLDMIGKYLSTPHKLIEKNIQLLLKFNIISEDNLPSSIVSLCGSKTEYLLDRFIEASLYRKYLLPKEDNDGNKLSSVGTSRLYLTTNDLMFYKIKRAQDVGDSVFRNDGCIKKIFTDNGKEYMGIKLEKNDSGRAVGIIQEPMTMEMIDKIPPSIRKWLPNKFYSDKNNSFVSSSLLEYENIYNYRTFSPIDIFAKDSVKAELIDKIFNEDYTTLRDTDSVLDDEIIKKIDNATYCNSYGIEKPLKISEFEYEFTHPEFTNSRLIISRQKVLRLCKLLKDNECWINDSTSFIEKENIIMSILVKDSILSNYEISMLKACVREILSNGFIKSSTNDKRGSKK